MFSPVSRTGRSADRRPDLSTLLSEATYFPGKRTEPVSGVSRDDPPAKTL
jgi:hypothetical protein